MTPTLTLTPRDRRSATFFWLGIGVFPMFWSWFTLSKKFTNWQRFLAFVWLGVIANAIWYTWPQAMERLEQFATGLPVVGLLLTLGLFVWLFLRITQFPPFAFMIALLFSANLPRFAIEVIDALSVAPSAWAFAWLPLVPATLHLLLKPVQEALK